MSPTKLLTRCGVTTAAAIAVLGGCATESTAPTTARPSAAASTPAATEPAAATGSMDDLCSLVTVAAVQAATRSAPPITMQQKGTFVHGEPECGFASADGDSGSPTSMVNVTLFDAATTPLRMDAATVAEGSLTPVAGLGQGAGVNDLELDVLVGTHLLVAENFGSSDLSHDQLIAVAKLFLAKLS